MVGSVIRSVAALVVSCIAALVLVIAVEGIGAVFHPFPPGADPNDIEVCKTHVSRSPGWLLGVVVILWGATALVASYVATRLGSGRHPLHGYAIGLLLLAAVGFNMWLLPYPKWFEVANLVCFPLATYYGARLGRGPRVAGGET